MKMLSSNDLACINKTFHKSIQSVHQRPLIKHDACVGGHGWRVRGAICVVAVVVPAAVAMRDYSLAGPMPAAAPPWGAVVDGIGLNIV